MLSKLIEPKAQIPAERKRFSDKALWLLIYPVIIEQFLAMLVGLADTMMISYAGEDAVSGVSLVNQLNNVFIMVFTALAAGGAVVASQYVGSQKKEEGVRAASQLVTVTTIVSVVLMGVVLLLGSPIFHTLFGAVEQGVYSSGMTYLNISALSFPFLAIYNSCAGLFRSMGKTRTTMYVSLAMNAINVVGNAIGIFVLHAGVAGVAYPSLISRIFAAAAMIVLAFDKKNVLFLRVKELLAWHGSTILKIVRVAVPTSVQNGLFSISKVALSSIVALFGTVQIAANGVAQSFWSMAALFTIAMGPVFITIIGQYMGAGDHEGAEYYMQKLLRITYAGALVWNVVFFAATPLLLMLYSLSEEAVRLVMILCLIHNVFNILFTPSGYGMSNGLRAAGDVKYAMFASIFSTVICRVLLSYVLGIWLNLGVIGIALAMAGDWGINAALISFRYRSGKWKKFKVI